MEDCITRREHDEFAKRVDEWQKRQDARIGEAEEKIDQIARLNSNIERLAVSMESMQKEQAKQGERLEALEARDGDMWRTAVKYIVTALIGGIVAYLLTAAGL